MWPPWVGVFVSCRGFPGMSFSCGTQLSTDCEKEGPHAPWVGLAFLPKSKHIHNKMLQPPILKTSHSRLSENRFFRLHTDVCRTFIKQKQNLDLVSKVKLGISSMSLVDSFKLLGAVTLRSQLIPICVPQFFWKILFRPNIIFFGNTTLQ